MTESSKSQPTHPAKITEHEAQQIERANAAGRQPVVFASVADSWKRFLAL